MRAKGPVADRRSRGALALIVLLGPIGSAEAEGPSLTRLERPPYTPPPAAKPSPEKPDFTSQLDGPDDRQLVTARNAVTQLGPGVQIDARAIARFGNCTATHLGRGVFLTAGHCVDPQRGLVGFRSSPCPFDLELQGVGLARCNVVTFGYGQGEDHALLELQDPQLAASLPLVPVDYGFDWRSQRQRWVRVYGYSTGQLRMSPQCDARWDARSGRVVHRCDTEGGDSGAALIDLMTGYVVGVHAGALTSGGNYGFATDRLPWAQSLCVALTAVSPLDFASGGAPASLRVSTSQLSHPFRRVWVRLTGRSPRANTQLTVRAPDVELPVDTSWLRWSGATQWTWSEVLALDDARPGPWSIDVKYAPKPAHALTKGTVHGHVWVCP